MVKHYCQAFARSRFLLSTKYWKKFENAFWLNVSLLCLAVSKLMQFQINNLLFLCCRFIFQVCDVRLCLESSTYFHSKSANSQSGLWWRRSAFVFGAKDLTLKSQAGQIRRSVANSSPQLRLFKKSCVAQRNDMNIGLVNSILASAKYIEYNKTFDLILYFVSTITLTQLHLIWFRFRIFNCFIKILLFSSD